jgi:hypothetical protein
MRRKCVGAVRPILAVGRPVIKPKVNERAGLERRGALATIPVWIVRREDLLLGPVILPAETVSPFEFSRCECPESVLANARFSTAE